MTTQPARILVSGRMSSDVLGRALYAGWSTEVVSETDGGIVAIVSQVDVSANVDYMAGRLSSFGTVGVRTEFTDADVADAVSCLR